MIESSLSMSKVGEIFGELRRVFEPHLKNQTHLEVVSALLLSVACAVSAECRVTKRGIDEIKSDVLFTLSGYIDGVHENYGGKSDVD